MAAIVTPFTEDLIEAVKAFNARLHKGGVTMSFYESPIPDWLPKIDGRAIYDEYFLALDDGAVRGAYILKRQPFAVNGNVISIAQYRLPLSEGQFDKRYAPIGVQMYLDALRKEPRMYTVGLGGYDEPFAKLLTSAGWSMWPVPFYFRVLHPARFLRNIVYLRKTPLRRLAMDALAISGLGSLAIPLYQAMKTRHQPRDSSAVAYTLEPSFGRWADEVWEASASGYSLIGVRDADILNILYDQGDPRWVRLKVTDKDRVVGWAVVLNIAMQGHNYFGNMRVGSLIDCLALEGFENKVTCAAMHYLKSHGSDIVVTNLSHRAWRLALEAAGLFEGPSNYIFAASKQVTSLLSPLEENKDKVHMTRGDGGGPQNLLTALQIDESILADASSQA
jgi:hypothetical protein